MIELSIRIKYFIDITSYLKTSDYKSSHTIEKTKYFIRLEGSSKWLRILFGLPFTGPSYCYGKAISL